MTIEEAIKYKKQNPQESLVKAAKHGKVPKSTLHDRLKDTHAPRGERTKRHLSTQQEAALIDKINSYSNRGTHLTPQHIRQLAVAISEQNIGRNWASSFLRRHKEDLSSKYFKIQEASRMKSDTDANRKAFYTLVKAAYDDYHYLSSNIFNMDEAPFNMSTDRKLKRVAPKYKPTTSQAALANDCHITVVATISTSSAPVPPFLIYSGEYFIEEWAAVKDKDPLLMAAVSKTGYNNSYYMMKWLEEVFDPFTKNRANGNRRLLFLDGCACHDQVDFIEACWDRNIVCIFLPANMTNVFQPLDINFFNTLNLRYSQEIIEYQLGSDRSRIRSAWRRSGLFPLDSTTMCPNPALTPPPQLESTEPDTPTNSQTLKALDRTVRRGEIDLKSAFMKAQRALDKSFAEVALNQEDTKKRKAAEELDREVQASGKRTRYPQGQLYDPRYKREHAAELAERKKKQLEERRKKAAAELLKKQGRGSKRRNTCRRPTRRPTQKRNGTACLELEEFNEE